MYWVVNWHRTKGTSKLEHPIIAICSSAQLLSEAKRNLSKFKGTEDFLYFAKPVDEEKLKILKGLAAGRRKGNLQKKGAGASEILKLAFEL